MNPGTFHKPGKEPVNVTCVFCGNKTLIVAGRANATYLGCENCGADGPVARGGGAAINKYQDRPKPKLAQRTRTERTIE